MEMYYVHVHMFHVCVKLFIFATGPVIHALNNTLYITGGKHYTEFEHKISNSVYHICACNMY